MDDFYSSMKKILDNSSNEKLTKVREVYSSSLFAEALVSLNPYRCGLMAREAFLQVICQKLVTS